MNNAAEFYISYQDAVRHTEVRLGPYPSDVNTIELVKMVLELPKSASRIRIIIDQKDIDFGSMGYVNIHFKCERCFDSLVSDR